MGSPTGLYGAERWIIALIKHLPTDLVDSYVGVIEDEPHIEQAALCTVAEKLGFSTIQFRAYGKLSFSAIGKLRRFLQKHNINILHTHGYKTDLIGLLAVRGLDCKIVATPHGWSANAGIKLQIYELLDRLSFYFMDVVVPLSPDLYDGLAKLPSLASKMLLVKNGVDLSEIEATPMLSDAPPGVDIKGAFIVGYIGQLIPRKNIDSLIRVFQTLDIPGKQLWILGKGPEQRNLEILAASSSSTGNIHFLGFREDRIAFLKCFDVFVLPSVLEGIPRCLLEAMSAGIPVIASNIPGCTELIQDKATGLLFNSGNDSQLKAALETVFGCEEIRVAISHAGRDLVRKHFSAAAMADRYFELYSNLVGDDLSVGDQRQMSESDR